VYAKSFARKLLVLGFAFALAAAVPGQLLAQQAESMDMEVMGGGPPKGGNPLIAAAATALTRTTATR